MDAAPLTRNERIAFWVLAVLTAASRFAAISLTLWDWDEALFALAVRDYDVTLHHPHPPGFPLFIAVAKLLPLDPFHALQTITVVASLFVFPAMFFLARELRIPPFTAMAAGVLLAFFPNVWFYGGTALSDVPSMVLLLVASALLLRGRRSNASLIAGAVALGVAAGFRPQNLLIGCAPFLLAFLNAFPRRRRTAIVGGLMVAAIVIVSYVAAASSSGGWDSYRATLEKHEQYIRQTDSFLAPRHPGLVQVADDFFLRPYRAPVINIVITLLALLGLRRRPSIALAMFVPFLLFAWLFLDFHSASRFSIAYMPLYALLAALGIPRRGERVTLAAVAALLILWTIPALNVVRTTPSPPAAAVAGIRELAPPVVHVDPRLAAHAELLLPDLERRVASSLHPPGEGVLLREGASRAPGALSFVRERGRLAGIARPRYFEAAVIPALQEAR